MEEAQALDLMSDEHFTVDGTLMEACASLKSFKKVDETGEEKPQTGDEDPGNPRVDFHGEKRSNQTHPSRTDAEALLARKGAGKEAKLSYSGRADGESERTGDRRGGAPATGTAEGRRRC